jgi:hypothetical protein
MTIPKKTEIMGIEFSVSCKQIAKRYDFGSKPAMKMVTGLA